MTPILSIIIPVYNAEEYIVDTLDSVLTRIPSEVEVEVIIINDGSNDSSKELIEREFDLQLKRKQFILLDQLNAGVSVARNVGLELCKGDYVTFVDADDLLFDSYFEEILNAITKYSPDIIEFGCTKFSSKAEINNNNAIFTHLNFGFFETRHVIDDIFIKSVFYTPLRVVKKTLLTKLRFPIGVMFCEDMIFLYQLYLKSQSIVHLDKVLYAYRDNESGATRNMKPEYLVSMVSLYRDLLSNKTSEIMFLKVNVFYVIYRCSCGIGTKVSLPFDLFWNSKLLAVKMLFQQKIPLRKRLILLAPNIFQLLRRTKEHKKVNS